MPLRKRRRKRRKSGKLMLGPDGPACSLFLAAAPCTHEYGISTYSHMAPILYQARGYNAHDVAARRGINLMDTDNITVDISKIYLISDIVAAYVSNNRVPAAELPNLIATVHAAIGNLTNGGTPAEPEAEKPTPAQIRKSITQDALISFIDGKKYKTIKRHLANHGLTPDTYRAQFGLPADYPMVSPSYSQKRSALALSLGLGQRGRGKPPGKSEA